MAYLQASLRLAGVVLLARGYRRDRGDWPVAAAMLLFLSGDPGPIVRGLAEGSASTDMTPPWPAATTDRRV